jgi:hypothetical protein
VLAGKNIKFGVMAPAATWVAVGLPREGSGLVGADVIVLKEEKVSLLPRVQHRSIGALDHTIPVP